MRTVRMGRARPGRPAGPCVSGGVPAMSRGRDMPAGLPPHVLRDYALLADGERGALVGPRGDIAWMCAPHWDSGAVFSSMIGGSGFYAITPDERFTWGGYYEEGSLIWRSRWITTGGIAECREALAYPGDARIAVLLRRIEAADGPQLKPAYTITGGPVPDEQSLSGLAGYPGAAVKTGNWVNQLACPAGRRSSCWAAPWTRPAGALSGCWGPARSRRRAWPCRSRTSRCSGWAPGWTPRTR